MAVQRYLLDTDILSDLVKHPAGRVAERIAEVGEGAVCTSIVVACELRFGAAKKRSSRLTRRIDQLLDRIEILPLGGDVDRRYADLRVHLEQRATPIGPNDMLIAAHALSARRVLVSRNVREFQRVPGLAVENWLDARQRGP